MDIRITPHPFYEPYWRRVAIVVSVAIWLAVEIFVSHDGMWTAVAGGLLVYCIWQFLIAYPQADKKE
jgi:hypothetical protein